MKTSKFLGSISIIIFYTLSAKALSFIVELLLAIKFGANDQTDIFYMAYGIIQVLYPMISIGIWKVVMPEYKARITLKQYNEATLISNKLLFIFILIVATSSVLIMLYPQLLIHLFAPGFDLIKTADCSKILRILSIIFTLNTISTFCAAILQANGYFGQSQLKEVIQHIPSVIFLLFFTAWYGINGVSVSIVIGAVLSTITTIHLTKKIYEFHLPKSNIFDKEIIEILKSVPVACINSIINQINGIVDRAFSSSLATGALTYLNYGSRLIHLFEGIFSTAISTVLFPHMTELVAKHEDAKLKVLIRDYLLIISAMLIPISCFIIIYPSDLINVAFGYGNFNMRDVTTTSTVMMMYAIGLPVMGITTVINDLFYIKKRAKDLLVTTIICIAINVILDCVLIRQWGVAGLALATSIAYYLAFFIKITMLKEIIRIDWFIIKNLLLVIALSMLSIFACQFIKYIYPHKIIRLIIMFTVFGAVYITLLSILSKYYRNRILPFMKQ